jgi:poly-gamma-glutamate capsule biosynthesis protein CapA/YwtB (metallophosphatase superfamily)
MRLAFLALFAVVLAACTTAGADPTLAPPGTDVGSTVTTVPGSDPAEAPLSTTAVAPPATTTSTSSSTSTTTLAPITIAFAGDTSFTHGLADRDPLGDVVPELSAPDLSVVNLESTVAEASVGSPIQKRFLFKSPPKTAAILADAGVDVAALANNHALDYGPEAVLRTIEILEAGGVATAGTGVDAAAAYEPLWLAVGGWNVAIASFSRVPCDSPEPGETYIDEVAWACPQFEEATIDAVASAADADLLVVMVHWGVQSRACPAAHQHDLAAAWIAAGADIVVGSHPHVLQGVERIDGAWVVHSTGNFAFPSARGASSYTALFTFTVAADGTELTVEPMRILSGRPVVATSSRQGILDLLTERSFGFAFDADGRAVATDSTGRCG